MSDLPSNCITFVIHFLNYFDILKSKTFSQLILRVEALYYGTKKMLGLKEINRKAEL